MPDRLKSRETTSYRRPLALSLLLHGAVVLLIAGALLWQRRGIEKQEERFLTELKKTEEERLAADEAARREMVNSLAQDRVEVEIADILRDDVKSETREALQEEALRTLRELFEQARNRQLTEEELTAIRTEALDKLQAAAQQRLVAAVVSQIRTYIHDELAPTAVREMERSLHQHGSTRILKEMQDFMQRHKAGEADSTILRESLGPMHRDLEQRIRENVARTLVPEATAKVLNQFQKELEPLPVDHRELRELIAADVLAAMREEMQATQPQEETATLRSRAALGLEDGSKAQAAEREAAALEARAQALAERQQQALAQADTRAAAEAQRQITGDVEALDREVADASRRAQLRATGHQAWRLGRPEQLAELSVAPRFSRQAAKSLEDGFQEEGRRAQGTTLEHLQSLIEPLQVTRQQLAEDARKHQEAAARRKEIPATPEMQEKARELAAAVKETLAEVSRMSVADAAQRLQPKEVLGAEFNNELQAALEFQQKIASAKHRITEGRALSADVLQAEATAMRPGNGGIPLHHLANHQFNREAYEAFVKDLKNRSDPGNAYGDTGPVEGLATKATGPAGEVPAYVYLPAGPAAPAAAGNGASAAPRELVRPDFKSIDFAAAPMQSEPIRIDGDLSDWGPLEHPITMKWYADDANQTFAGGIPLHMRWAPEGLYFAYRVETTSPPRIPDAHSPYAGDVLEIWLDMENSRDASMKASQFAHQFILSPFGFRGSGGTYVEYGRGARGLTEGRNYLDETDRKGLARGKTDPSGYTVEAFIATSSLAKPVLIPGSYLAMNFSINRGSFGGKQATQWSASKSIDTHLKPDTWGDVLLLGTDAAVRIPKADNPAEDEEYLVIGNPIHLEVTDKDMNIRPDLKDRVAASLLTAQAEPPLLVILEETGPGTGVFRASADTQPFFKSARPNTLNLRQGDTVTFEYKDPRAAYGETGRTVTARLPVAWAVYAEK